MFFRSITWEVRLRCKVLFTCNQQSGSRETPVHTYIVCHSNQPLNFKSWRNTANQRTTLKRQIVTLNHSHTFQTPSSRHCGLLGCLTRTISADHFWTQPALREWKTGDWQDDSVHATGEYKIGELTIDGSLGRCTHVFEVRVKWICAVNGRLRLTSLYLGDGHVQRLQGGQQLGTSNKGIRSVLSITSRA